MTASDIVYRLDLPPFAAAVVDDLETLNALMQRQHEWIAARGYTVVETAANQENVAMAQANLRHGFSVCGLRVEAARTQVLYSKSLGAES